MMEGTASHTPVIDYLSKAFPDGPFMLVDIGCSGGIDPVWRRVGSRLHALAIDPNVAEIERLTRAEPHAHIEYLAARAVLPADHPFALRMQGRGPFGRSPWERLSVAKSIELMKSKGPGSTSEMVAANRWQEVELSDDVIVIPKYLHDRGVTSIDFLKIDVDGSDFEILHSFDLALDALCVIGVGIEVNYFGSASDSDHTFHNVDRFMKARGFELFGLTVRRYTAAALPGRYVWKLPSASEFGRPLQGDALYIRDLGSADYDAFTARLPVTKLANLISIFSAFNLPDCAAEIVLRFRERLYPRCDVARLLDLLAAQAQWPSEQPLEYQEYLRRFESNDPMFYTPHPSSAMLKPDTTTACQDAATIPPHSDSERNMARDLYEIRRQLRFAHDVITAMESSRFWKMRRIWFKLKRAVGLNTNE